MKEKVKKYFSHPAEILVFIQNRCNFRVLPDVYWLKVRYKLALGKKLNLTPPKTFNEKMQWLKLYDRKPEYTRMVDKYEVKRYIEEKIGREYVVPMLCGAWEHFDEIDFDSLPDQFVLKCTHDSGGLIIVRDKWQLDKSAAKQKIEKCLRKNYYLSRREWPYKDVKPRIIAEQYMEDDGGRELTDYKVMCFNGEPKVIQVHKGRFGIHTQAFYDCNWKRMDISREGGISSDASIERPIFLEEMLELSKVLSENIPFLRVDWYFSKGRLWFGELTFFPASGMKAFEPESWDDTFGMWLLLPERFLYRCYPPNRLL